MSLVTILLIVLVVLALGGGGYGYLGGNPGYAHYGLPGIGIGTVLLIILLLVIFRVI